MYDLCNIMHIKLSESYVHMIYGKDEERSSWRKQDRESQCLGDTDRQGSVAGEGRISGNQCGRIAGSLCKGSVKRTERNVGGILRSQIGTTRDLIAYYESALEGLKAQLNQLETLQVELERQDISPDSSTDE